MKPTKTSYLVLSWDDSGEAYAYHDKPEWVVVYSGESPEDAYTKYKEIRKLHRKHNTEPPPMKVIETATLKEIDP